MTLLDQIKDDDPGPARWLLYKKVSAGRRWHAWTPGNPESVCRHLKFGKLGGRIVDRSDETPEDTEGAPVCRTCRKRLGIARNPEGRGQEAPVASREHTSASGCACDECREARKAGAQMYVARLESKEVREVACACVRRAVASGSWELRGLIPYLEESERRLTIRLLLWELTGCPSARKDAGDARSLILDSWKALARTYGGTHTCDSTQQGKRK